MLNVFQPSLGDEELEAVRRVFASNWIGKGHVTAQFEQAFAAFCGVSAQHMRSISCATEGLFQAMTLLNIGPGDEVVLPTLSFVGAANAVLAAGARPVFCDVDARTLNATAADIEVCLSPRTRAVLLLHYGGVPCRMEEILALLMSRSIALIEDSACSVASTWHGRACGTLGDIGIWSFDAMKILVTGDGGMVYCRNPEMSIRLERLIYLGLEQPSGYTQAMTVTDEDKGPSAALQRPWWAFEVTEPGRRAIMNDIAAAIGLVQLHRLPLFIERRRQIHALYNEALADLAWLQLPPPLPPDCQSSYYFYWVQCPNHLRDALALHLRRCGIYTTFRYYPLHRVRVYGFYGQLPRAETAAATTLCLPIHQSLDDDDLARIVEAIWAFGTRI